MNKENEEEDGIITANVGESITDFTNRLNKIIKGKGVHVHARFNNVIFTVEDGEFAMNAYLKAEREHSEEIEREREAEERERRKQASKNIVKVCKEFVEKYAGRTDIDESEIMKLLGEIGKNNFDDDFLDIDSSVSEQLIQLLEQNGYKSKSSDKQYRIGKDSYDGGKNNFVVNSSFIVCRNGEDLSKFNASQLARFSIENAMSQLSSGRPYFANSDLAYMYEKMKRKEDELSKQLVNPELTPEELAENEKAFAAFEAEVRGDNNRTENSNLLNDVGNK